MLRVQMHDGSRDRYQCWTNGATRLLVSSVQPYEVHQVGSTKHSWSEVMNNMDVNGLSTAGVRDDKSSLVAPVVAQGCPPRYPNHFI